MKELETKLKEIKSIVDDLLKEIEQKPLLTKKQRWHLQQDLEYYQKATGHKYTHVQVAFEGDSFLTNWGCVKFYYFSERGNNQRYDVLGGAPCYTTNLNFLKRYTLEELGVK